MLLFINLLLVTFTLHPGTAENLISHDENKEYLRYIKQLDTGQRKLILLNGKMYTDTAWSSSFKPDSIFVYYYNVRSKYPESSETIREKSRNYLRIIGRHFSGSGYITFRFFIDSIGQMQKRVQVLQMDEQYKVYRFSEGLVWDLYDYLKTLQKWKPAKAPKGYPPFYIGLMTFKIHEGNIVNIIP
jgi:hypothetical protein